MKTQKLVNLTEITESMESMGFTSTYSAGKVTFKKGGDILSVSDKDTLEDFLWEVFRWGQDNTPDLRD